MNTNIPTSEQIKRAEQCPHHRVVLVGTDEVYANKYAEKLGQDPVAYTATFDCLTCKAEGRSLNLVYEFKNPTL